MHESSEESRFEPEPVRGAADVAGRLCLRADLDGVPVYEIGTEIWQTALEEAIRDQAEAIAEHSPARSRQEAMATVIVAMSAALQGPGDSYIAPDGVRYLLAREESVEEEPPTIRSVVFEDLPVGATGSRRAIGSWSDGATSEVARWYDDEILFSEGDLIGKSSAQVRALHFRRDRDWLRS